MKHVTAILAAAIFLFAACSKPNATDTVDSHAQPLTNDSLKLAALDTLVYQMDTRWGARSAIDPIFEFALDDRDTFKYQVTNGEATRISSMFFPENKIVWFVFFKHEGELFFVRYREWQKAPTPMVKEALSYLDHGKVFYSRERSCPLEPDQPPSVFRRLPFVENNRKPEELTAEYAPYWEITQKAVKEDIEKRK